MTFGAGKSMLAKKGQDDKQFNREYEQNQFVYIDRGQQGSSVDISGYIFSFQSLDFNDAISSVEGTGILILYEHARFNGINEVLYTYIIAILRL